jgi:uncharacterized protein (DUF169 family)
MDDATMISLLKTQVGIKKPAVALKLAKEEPSHIEAYRDKNNICYMFAEAIAEGRTFYTTMDDHVCLLGCAATGLDPSLEHMSDEERKQSEQLHVSSINIFPTKEIQRHAEEQADKLFPKFTESYKAVIIGPFGKVPEPDVLIIFGTAEQVHLLTRAYAYATGNFIMGYAGMGACRMLLPYAFLKKEPVFTISDRAWRRALQLSPDELTMVTPSDKCITMLVNLEACQQY